MSVNQVNSFNPNFRGDERKRSGSFAPGFVVGTGAGLLATKAFPLNFLKSEITSPDQLKGIKADEFKLSGDLTAEQKKAEQTVRDYLAKQDKETPTETKTETEKTSKKGKATTEAKPEIKDAKLKSVASNGITLGEIFEKETELTPSEYLNKKYGLYSTQDLMDEIQAKKQGLPQTDKKTKDIKSAEYKLSNAKEYAKNHQESLKIEHRLEKLAKEKDELTESLKGLDEKSPKYKLAQRKISSIANEESQLNKKKLGLQEKLDKLTNRVSSFEKDQDAIEKMIEKANKEGGRIHTAGKEAEKKAIKEFENAAADEARKKARSEKKSPDEVNQAVEDAKKNIKTEKKAEIEAAVDKAKAKKEMELKHTFVEGQAKKHYESKTTELQHELNKETSTFSKQKATISEMNADLELIRNAKKTNGKITVDSASKVMRSSSAKVKEEIAKVGGEAAKAGDSALAKAIEALKGHMPKVAPGWGKALAISAGVGVVLGLITKAMGGSKEEA